MRRRDLLAALAGAAAVLVLAGSVAWAAIPSDGGMIEGCYTKVGGVLRVIDTAKGQRCHASLEIPISWNQKGQKGDPGAAGANGSPGAPGEKGAPGEPGANGSNGADGTSVTVERVDPVLVPCSGAGVRLAAANGTTVLCDGARGEQGAAGERGPQGEQGIQGPQGVPGPAGSGAKVDHVMWSSGFVSGTIGVTKTGTGTWELAFPPGHSNFVFFTARPSFPGQALTTTCDWTGSLNAAGTTLTCKQNSDGALIDVSFTALVVG